MADIFVTLPEDREQEGTLELIDSQGRVIISVPALGNADRTAANRHNNPDRNPLRQFGVTPTGTYSVAGFRQTPTAQQRRFGPHGKIELRPTAGDALEAATAGGRTHLQIHGGFLRDGKLRPTNGCVRISDESMRILLDQIALLGEETRTCFAIEVDVVEGGKRGDAIGGDPDNDPPAHGGMPLQALPHADAKADRISRPSPNVGPTPMPGGGPVGPDPGPEPSPQPTPYPLPGPQPEPEPDPTPPPKPKPSPSPEPTPSPPNPDPGPEPPEPVPHPPTPEPEPEPDPEPEPEPDPEPEPPIPINPLTEIITPLKSEPSIRKPGKKDRS